MEASLSDAKYEILSIFPKKNYLFVRLFVLSRNVSMMWWKHQLSASAISGTNIVLLNFLGFFL